MNSKSTIAAIAVAFTFGLITSSAEASLFSSFTDSSSFASWYADSAYKMEFNQVMTGYPDGEFKGTETVNRAELAVILDRYAQQVVGTGLKKEASVCPYETEYGVEIHVVDQMGNPLENVTVDVSLGHRIKAEVTSPGFPSSWSFESLGAGVYRGFAGGNDLGSFVLTLKKEGYGNHYESVVLQKNDCYSYGLVQSVTMIKELK